jgi:hypothetical protein
MNGRSCQGGLLLFWRPFAVGEEACFCASKEVGYRAHSVLPEAPQYDRLRRNYGITLTVASIPIGRTFRLEKMAERRRCMEENRERKGGRSDLVTAATERERAPRSAFAGRPLPSRRTRAQMTNQ